jgi:hypothetical protein
MGREPKKTPPARFPLLAQLCGYPIRPCCLSKQGELTMTTTSHTTRTLPTFADYQQLEGENIDLLPFVSSDHQRTNWNHWDISHPATHQAQDEYGCRLAAHFVQFIAATNDGSGCGSPLLRDMVADMCKQYGNTKGRFGGEDWAVTAAFFDFIEKILAAYVPAETDVLAIAEGYIQTLAAEWEEDSQPDTPPRPYMIREVVTNIPGWWLGETPVIEYEAAIWAAGGNIHRQQFKTHDEAEAWAKGSDYHG